MLSYTSPAVTTADADAYFLASGDSAWTGSDAVKEAAIIRGQRYVAGLYNARFITAFENDVAPEPVRFAVMEAARREMMAPGSLSPVVAAGPEKVLTGVKGITWTVTNDGSGRRVPILPSIEGLLFGLVTPATGSTTVSMLVRA